MHCCQWHKFTIKALLCNTQYFIRFTETCNSTTHTECIVFPLQNSYTNTPQYYITHTLPILLKCTVNDGNLYSGHTVYTPWIFFMGFIEEYIGNCTYINWGLYDAESGGEWSVNGQYAHFMLSWSTQQIMPVGCGQMRWQSDMDRRCQEVEHLHSVNTYTYPIGNITHTILRFAHTVHRHVVPDQTAKIQPVQATLDPWTPPPLKLPPQAFYQVI